MHPSDRNIISGNSYNIDENNNKAHVSLEAKKDNKKSKNTIILLDLSSEFEESSSVDEKPPPNSVLYCLSNDAQTYLDLRKIVKHFKSLKVVQKKHNIKIYDSDLATLSYGKWLNDKIINLYFYLLLDYYLENSIGDQEKNKNISSFSIISKAKHFSNGINPQIEELRHNINSEYSALYKDNFKIQNSNINVNHTLSNDKFNKKEEQMKEHLNIENEYKNKQEDFYEPNKILNKNIKKFYAMSTFFYVKLKQKGLEYIKRSWTKGKNLFSYTHILIPIHLSNHWIFSYIDIEEKTIFLLDSMNISRSTVLKRLKMWIEDEYLEKYKNLVSFKITQLFDIELQNNGDDCGVFVCYYAKRLIDNCPTTSKKINTLLLRMCMIHEIGAGKILYPF
ncbi:hypothetical protein EDEG_00091 [Edhazardia aedis USNM 41457]|uniref:Ubiquitin-like protease family profile domain-containing protein n=1 Tax=Edhazardia aedis (strain USNM 41457) TaxID=1003232 RepID=J9DBV5_EDHAE|nr:hypothetical protein EDEG_00091 [Edhazardia aedis USNM 41457]|eukprot:EJW04974.1 hypothetical protein EDEG_00091 [Edhazardia aedis USNM 41457]